MKKKIIALLLVFTLVLLTTACGSQPASIENTSASTSSEGPNSVTTTDTTEDPIAEPDSFDALEENVLKDVEKSVSSLSNEMQSLVEETNSFDKYIENVDKAEAFYSKICTESTLLRIRLMEHSVTYAEFIMNSTDDFEEKYDNLDELYDAVYEDAGDAFYDGIYDGILEEMYDAFYDGLLSDVQDEAPYDKWFDACTDEYEWWLDSRSDVYETWLDTRSDIYEFWLDLRGAAYERDTEEIEEIISDFKEDIQDLKEKSA